jgi:hypothetical protein
MTNYELRMLNYKYLRYKTGSLLEDHSWGESIDSPVPQDVDYAPSGARIEQIRTQMVREKKLREPSNLREVMKARSNWRTNDDRQGMTEDGYSFVKPVKEIDNDEDQE